VTRTQKLIFEIWKLFSMFQKIFVKSHTSRSLRIWWVSWWRYSVEKICPPKNGVIDQQELTYCRTTYEKCVVYLAVQLESIHLTARLNTKIVVTTVSCASLKGEHWDQAACKVLSHSAPDMVQCRCETDNNRVSVLNAMVVSKMNYGSTARVFF